MVFQENTFIYAYLCDNLRHKHVLDIYETRDLLGKVKTKGFEK